jgi:hypothetical protein
MSKSIVYIANIYFNLVKFITNLNLINMYETILDQDEFIYEIESSLKERLIFYKGRPNRSVEDIKNQMIYLGKLLESERARVLVDLMDCTVPTKEVRRQINTSIMDLESKYTGIDFVIGNKSIFRITIAFAIANVKFKNVKIYKSFEDLELKGGYNIYTKLNVI